ncbi:PHD multi-domain protein [Pyrenophora teres f. maculata]|nr:PHD multi-domain protein [Pyrenophora teres f. maculata]
MLSKSSLLVLASQIFGVIIHSLAKSLSTTGKVDPQQILQIRMFITLSFNVLVLTYQYPEELPLGSSDIKHLLALRSLGGLCGSFGYYYSLQYLSLADATVLNLLSPLIGGIVTSQKFSSVRLGAAVVCLFGVGLVAKPALILDILQFGTEKEGPVIGSIAKDKSTGTGMIFAAIGVFGGVCTYFSLSKIGTRAHALAITNCYAISVLFVSTFCFLVVPGVNFNFHLSLLQLLILFIIGIFGALMENLFTMGMTLEKDSVAVYMAYLQAVLALIVDAVVWSNLPDLGSLIGSIIIVSALLVVEKHKMKEQKLIDTEMALAEMSFTPSRMNPPNGANGQQGTGNGAPNEIGVAANMSGPAPSSHSTTPMPPASQMSSFPVNNTGATSAPSFPEYSASTAAILERLQGKSGHAAGSAAFEAKRAEILQSYVTSDKLPTPPPIMGPGRRGRGGRVGTPSGLKTEVGASPTGPPISGRGSGRGRGRGRGGRGGRGGKRKRSESEEESDNDGSDSNVSDSYTPLPTRTKSGRSVNKPVAFVPTIPEPVQGVKRRKSTKTLLAAKCKTCQRETDPSNNRIVFCDACSTAYHQYCHNPPIDNDVVTVLEKEWLCGPCTRAKQTVVEGSQDLVAVQNLSIDEKRAYFSTLPQHQLVDLLLTATVRHPELPIFPPNVRNLIPSASTIKPEPHQQTPSAPQRYPQYQAQPTSFHANGQTTASHTPQFSSHPHSEMDAAEVQLLGESSHQPSRTTIDLAGNQYDEDDGYDTDPPAHYPKAGNGLARTLRPESEDLNWLVDDNFEVFSHGWKGDGTGMGADGALDEGQKLV